MDLQAAAVDLHTRLEMAPRPRLHQGGSGAVAACRQVPGGPPSSEAQAPPFSVDVASTYSATSVGVTWSLFLSESCTTHGSRRPCAGRPSQDNLGGDTAPTDDRPRAEASTAAGARALLDDKRRVVKVPGEELLLLATPARHGLPHPHICVQVLLS